MLSWQVGWEEEVAAVTWVGRQWRKPAPFSESWREDCKVAERRGTSTLVGKKGRSWDLMPGPKM